MNKGTSGVQHLIGSTFSALERDPGDSAQVTNTGCYRDTGPLQIQMDRSRMQWSFTASQWRESTISYCSCQSSWNFPRFSLKKGASQLSGERHHSVLFTAISHLPSNEQCLLRRAQGVTIAAWASVQTHARFFSVERWFLFLSSPPAWSESSSAQFFQVNKLKTPEAAECIRHSLC